MACGATVVCDEVRAASGGCVVSDLVDAVSADADRADVSVMVRVVSSVRTDEASRASVAFSDRRALVDDRRSPLRNRRHVSELCSGPPEFLMTAGFALNFLLVSSSSRPGDGQSVANLVTGQRRRELAAVCPVDVAGVKTAVAQFVLHLTHVFVCRN